MGFTEKQKYIKQIFLPEKKKEGKEYLPEKEVNEIVSKIWDMGERYGFIGEQESGNEHKLQKRKHKYDVWIAKEIKKDIERKKDEKEYLHIIDRFSDIRLIFDWVIHDTSNPDLFKYSFEDSFIKQKEWHQEIWSKYDINEIKVPDISKERVWYWCDDQEHFLYLLTPKDLKYEGAIMKNCVAGKRYKKRVKEKKIIILSLRDSKNKPHVTIEIDVNLNEVVQQYGKTNTEPKEEYKKMIYDFFLFVTNCKSIENPKVKKFLNLHLLK